MGVLLGMNSIVGGKYPISLSLFKQIYLLYIPYILIGISDHTWISKEKRRDRDMVSCKFATNFEYFFFERVPLGVNFT